MVFVRVIRNSSRRLVATDSGSAIARNNGCTTGWPVEPAAIAMATAISESGEWIQAALRPARSARALAAPRIGRGSAGRGAWPSAHITASAVRGRLVYDW